jgi:hypothetical protein
MPSLPEAPLPDIPHLDDHLAHPDQSALRGISTSSHEFGGVTEVESFVDMPGLDADTPSPAEATNSTPETAKNTAETPVLRLVGTTAVQPDLAALDTSTQSPGSDLLSEPLVDHRQPRSRSKVLPRWLGLDGQGYDSKKHVFIGPTGIVEEYDDLGDTLPITPETPKPTTVLTPPERLTQEKALRGFARIERFLDPKRVLELKDSIDSEVRKRTDEARLFDGRYQVGFSKVALDREVTQRHLAKYFGVTIEELYASKKVPMWAQARVTDLLEIPQPKLEKLAERLQHVRARDRFNTNAYILSMKPRELAAKRREINQEVRSVVGYNIDRLALPGVQEAIRKITQRREVEWYFMHQIENERTAFREGYNSPQGLHRLAENYIADLQADREAQAGAGQDRPRRRRAA